MVLPTLRYDRMYGVPDTTSSRVFAIRPGRPDSGSLESWRSARATIRSTIAWAARSLFCAMYAWSASRSANARPVQKSFILLGGGAAYAWSPRTQPTLEHLRAV